jgi:flagellar biosynthesis/type III secretory pathway protein FliH
MAFSEFSRADEIDAARTRRFDSLSIAEVAPPPRIEMRDPQQYHEYGEEAPMVGPGMPLGATAMVEPVIFESLAHPRLIDHSPDAITAHVPHIRTPQEEAQAIIAEARSTARSMLAQAREVIAAERAQAVRQGYEEGHAQGAAEADAETAGLVQTCERIGIHVMEERERVLAENEADLVELAMAIARRIVNASIDVDETLVIEACRGAMRKAFQRGALHVLAHPADLELLRAAGPQLAAELGGVEHLDFIEERRLDRGSVIVRTPAGEIDATIEGKSAKIELALREGIEQRRAERNAAA